MAVHRHFKVSMDPAHGSLPSLQFPGQIHPPRCRITEHTISRAHVNDLFGNTRVALPGTEAPKRRSSSSASAWMHLSNNARASSSVSRTTVLQGSTEFIQLELRSPIIQSPARPNANRNLVVSGAFSSERRVVARKSAKTCRALRAPARPREGPASISQHCGAGSYGVRTAQRAAELAADRIALAWPSDCARAQPLVRPHGPSSTRMAQ